LSLQSFLLILANGRRIRPFQKEMHFLIFAAAASLETEEPRPSMASERVLELHMQLQWLLPSKIVLSDTGLPAWGPQALQVFAYLEQ
jgi:hypothetical protein